MARTALFRAYAYRTMEEKSRVQAVPGTTSSRLFNFIWMNRKDEPLRLKVGMNSAAQRQSLPGGTTASPDRSSDTLRRRMRG